MIADVGAVIVTHAAPHLALQAARLIIDQGVSPRNVAVVCNHASYESGPVRELESVGARVLINQKALGYGANLNRGVRQLSEEVRFVLLVNDDAFAQPGALEELRRGLVAEPCVGLVGPGVHSADGTPQPSAFRFPTPLSELSYVVLLPYPLLERLRNRVAVVLEKRAARAEWVLGAAMLVRREAFEAVGGFDETFFLYSEETDLAYRLVERGWGVRWATRATFVHLGEASTNDAKYAQMQREARGAYIRRHWTTRDRTVLRFGLMGARIWNGLVVALARVTRPRSYRSVRERADALWASRPVL